MRRRLFSALTSSPRLPCMGVGGRAAMLSRPPALVAARALLSSRTSGAEPPLALSVDPAFDAWRARWRSRLAREGRTVEVARTVMQRVNPAIIARNHRVEEALYAAERRNDLQPLHALLDALRRPFDPTTADAPFIEAPPASFKDYQTFCGT